jgi:hypothetical protein
MARSGQGGPALRRVAADRLAGPERGKKEAQAGRGTAARSLRPDDRTRRPEGSPPHVCPDFHRADCPEVGGKVRVRQVGIRHEAIALLAPSAAPGVPHNETLVGVVLCVDGSGCWLYCQDS